MTGGDWEGTASRLAQYLEDSNERSLESYRSMPEWIVEHHHIEQAIAEGGYGHRQVYELVQNGADAMVGRTGGKIEVVLTESHLYCANEGEPIDKSGLGALLGSNVSPKRGEEIGRFGLGFKSVLAVTSSPEFFSRPVSLRFSPDFSEDLIRSRVPDTDGIPLPTLRLGEPLDPAVAAKADPVLRELMAWSVTVVRLRREPGRDTSWLGDDVAGFPTEFLLFARHVSHLVLDDRTCGNRRAISVQRGGIEVRLLEGTRNQGWAVFQRVVEPPPEARRDAGARAERDKLPIDWAVPLDGPSGIGKFWAFFPTTFETTLSGILNAPWKTNPDRENLLVGAFNEFMLDEASDLVVANLQHVTTVDDPGRHLDRMPARGREARAWADRRITEQVYELAASEPSLPDQRGELRLPRELRIHPERVPADALDLWCSFEFRPNDWVHPSVETRERRPRAERLLEAARQDLKEATPAIAGYREWLEALAAKGTVESSAGALAVADLLRGQLSPVDFKEVEQARIVLTEADELVAADPSRLFIGGHPAIAGTAAVNDRLKADAFAEQTLRQIFGIQDVDRSAEFAAIVADTSNPDADYWNRVWTHAAVIPPDQARQLLLRHHLAGDIKVPTMDGGFRSLRTALLPGSILRGDADLAFTIDEGANGVHRELLRSLGASETPRADREDSTDDQPWGDDYVEYVRACFKDSGRPIRATSRIESDHSASPSHVEIVGELSPDARARMTAELLRFPNTQERWTWRLKGGSQPGATETLSPAAWSLRQHGMLSTSQGPKAVALTLSSLLGPFGRVLPVTHLNSELTSVLGLPEELNQVPPTMINDGLGLLGSETDDELIGRYVAAVVRLVDPPDLLRCRVGRGHQNRPPQEITAIVSSELSLELRAFDIPVVLVPEAGDAELLHELWGLRREGELVSQEIGFQLSSPETPLIDEFPNLRVLPTMAEHLSATLLRCTELTLTIRAAGGQTTTALDRKVEGDRIYWVIGDSADTRRDDGELLTYVSDQLHLELSEPQIEALLKNYQDEQQRKSIERIRSQDTDIDRLLVCLGPEVLRRYVPNALIAAVEQQGHVADDRMIAEMAMAVHGVDILREARSDLERSGLQPPSQWAGGRAAQTFVRDLGFSSDYAGFPDERRDQVLEVTGPVELKELHDFQEVMRDRLRELLRSSGKTKRAMLSLPTGAGKTRVAVQGFSEHLAAGEITGPILWVAQSDELCEQAVQAWAEVWRAIGPPMPLTISRLWDANSAEPVERGAHVVVATIQKLDASVIDQARYDWLAKAEAVIVDEAHRAATTSVTTKLFRWLGLGPRGTDRCPLIGLTATPFIGTNEEQNKSLAARYAHRRLDTGLFPENDTEQLISLLQTRRILSEVKHEELPGVEVDLSESEMKELETFQRLPRAVEARLGLDADRNHTLVKSIGDRPDDWQILVFAASVEHSQTLAALLRLEGIESAAVTGETRSGARRHYIRQFKNRKIRVLTNYGVLTTGFDAPEVRAVYIARPTYSPNLYLQMIGRGLRGPANGGTKECLIADVKDNVRMYGGRLAFTDFEFLWSDHPGG